MRKTVILLSLVFFFWIYNSAFSAWYWNHGVTYTSWVTSCDSDWNTSWWSHSTYGEYAIANDNSSSTLVPETGTYTIPSSWTMRCLYWDALNPTWTISYSDWWTNTSEVISYSVSDSWWSKIKD